MQAGAAAGRNLAIVGAGGAGLAVACLPAMLRPLVTLAALATVFVLALAPDGRSDGGAGPRPAPAPTAQVTSRVTWLLAQQREDGSFGVDPATRVQTTAIVVLGLADRRLGEGARRAALGRAIDHLIARQDEAGAFREVAGGADRTLLGLLALFAYQEDDGARRTAGLALLGEGVAAAISAAPPATPADPTDEELVRVALTLAAP